MDQIYPHHGLVQYSMDMLIHGLLGILDTVPSKALWGLTGPIQVLTAGGGLQNMTSKIGHFWPVFGSILGVKKPLIFFVRSPYQMTPRFDPILDPFLDPF